MSSPRSTPAAARPRLEGLESREVPALFAIDDFYNVAQGQTLEVAASGGVLANDFSDQDFGAVLQATPLGNPQVVGSNRALPANTIQLNPDGSFTVVAPSTFFSDQFSQLQLGTVQIVFNYTLSSVSDPNEVTDIGQVVITLRQQGRQFFAVAPQPGQEPFVRVYATQTGELIRTIQAYETTFLGGVRVATGDFNGDGIDDIVTVPGLGGSARVRIFDGVGGDLLFDENFLDPNFRGGGYVAVQNGTFGAGTGNSVILGAGEGGGPIVTVIGVNQDPFNPNTLVGGGVGTSASQFFAYDPSIRSGVRVASGDFTGDGLPDIATAPGPGGGPQVKVFSGDDVINRVFPTVNQAGAVVIRGDRQIDAVESFFGGDSADRNGVYISGGNVDGKGAAEIITGTGSGPAVVRVYTGGGALLTQFGVPIEQTTSAVGAIAPSDPTTPPTFSLFPGTGQLLAPAEAPGSLVGTGTSAGPLPPGPGLAGGGVTVGTIDYNGDGADDIITGAGPANPPRVRIFTGGGRQLNSFLALQGNVLSGVNVG